MSVVQMLAHLLVVSAAVMAALWLPQAGRRIALAAPLFAAMTTGFVGYWHWRRSESRQAARRVALPYAIFVAGLLCFAGAQATIGDTLAMALAAAALALLLVAPALLVRSVSVQR